jgi:hypothetical protein
VFRCTTVKWKSDSVETFLSVKHRERNENKGESSNRNGKDARLSVKRNAYYFIQMTYTAESFQGVKVKQMWYWESCSRWLSTVHLVGTTAFPTWWYTGLNTVVCVGRSYILRQVPVLFGTDDWLVLLFCVPQFSCWFMESMKVLSWLHVITWEMSHICLCSVFSVHLKVL